jgi:hypothetical protein
VVQLENKLKEQDKHLVKLDQWCASFKPPHCNGQKGTNIHAELNNRDQSILKKSRLDGRLCLRRLRQSGYYHVVAYEISNIARFKRREVTMREQIDKY